jgi:hypothetical protein
MRAAGGGCLAVAGALLMLLSLLAVVGTASDMASANDWLHIGGWFIGIGVFGLFIGGVLLLAGRAILSPEDAAQGMPSSRKLSGSTLSWTDTEGEQASDQPSQAPRG